MSIDTDPQLQEAASPLVVVVRSSFTLEFISPMARARRYVALVSSVLSTETLAAGGPNPFEGSSVFGLYAWILSPLFFSLILLIGLSFSEKARPWLVVPLLLFGLLMLTLFSAFGIFIIITWLVAPWLILGWLLVVFWSKCIK